MLKKIEKFLNWIPAFAGMTANKWYRLLCLKKLNKNFLVMIRENIFKKKYMREGFSLIESVVVMVILATAMSGAVYLLGTVIKMTEKNKAQIKAIYLTQECTELVRNLRDTLWKRRLPWNCMFENAIIGDEFIIESDHSGQKTQICSTQSSTQVMGVKWQKIISSDDAKIYLSGTAYSHDSSGEKTPFARKVILKERVLKNGIEEGIVFDCETTGENGQKVILQSLLTNWYKP